MISLSYQSGHYLQMRWKYNQCPDTRCVYFICMYVHGRLLAIEVMPWVTVHKPIPLPPPTHFDTHLVCAHNR